MNYKFFVLLLAAIMVAVPTARSFADESREPDLGIGDITDHSAIAERIKSFEDDLKQNGLIGTISSCSDIVYVHVPVGGGNTSYGASCKIINKNFEINNSFNKILICNDEMVGHLAIVNNFYGTKQDIIKFVQEFCVGG